MDSKVPNINGVPLLNELKKQTRKFTGKTEDFKDNRERHFYQRMLKAYLRGDKKFQFGKSMKLNIFGFMELLPDWFEVQQELN